MDLLYVKLYIFCISQSKNIQLVRQKVGSRGEVCVVYNVKWSQYILQISHIVDRIAWNGCGELSELSWVNVS